MYEEPNKVVVVTGASRGIGRNIAKMLAIENYKIIANFNKSEYEAVSLKEELIRNGKNIDIFKADVSKREEVSELIKFAIDKYGRIDVLINNAGIGQYKMFTDITDEDWNNMINNNLTSVFFTIQESVQNMIHNKSGCIINISSIWAMVGGSCEAHYSASKAGIDGLTKALAKELRAI